MPGSGFSQNPPPEPERTPGRRAHPIWRAVKILTGLALLGLGVVGLFLPFLQGVLFMLAGLALLSSESRRLRRLLDRLRQRYPEAHALERRLVERFKRFGRSPHGGDSE